MSSEGNVWMRELQVSRQPIPCADAAMKITPSLILQAVVARQVQK